MKTFWTILGLTLFATVWLIFSGGTQSGNELAAQNTAGGSTTHDGQPNVRPAAIRSPNPGQPSDSSMSGVPDKSTHDRAFDDEIQSGLGTREDPIASTNHDSESDSGESRLADPNSEPIGNDADPQSANPKQDLADAETNAIAEPNSNSEQTETIDPSAMSQATEKSSDDSIDEPMAAEQSPVASGDPEAQRIENINRSVSDEDSQSDDSHTSTDQPSNHADSKLADKSVPNEEARTDHEEFTVSDPTDQDVGTVDSTAIDDLDTSEEPDQAPIDPANPAVTPVEVVNRDDGSLLVDDRYVVRGKGTKAEPYLITWDLLVSAQATYEPRRDKLEIPGRVMMLDKKYIEIRGYVAFPLISDSPREMLALLNAWDGCCIGVPPTPYDAIEVKLRKAGTPEQMLMSWGRISGLFKVEPYLAQNWLLGLYILEDGQLTEDKP